MKVNRVHYKQTLNINLDKAWEFFSNPLNLSKITPPWLSFKVTSNVENKMYPGQIITYKVRPLFNIPVTWVTEITHVQEPYYFVDEQRFGPYKMWHHEHKFREVSNESIEMDDIVTYIIPLGFFGTIINEFIVEKKINEIFNYRRKILESMFNNN